MAGFARAARALHRLPRRRSLLLAVVVLSLLSGCPEEPSAPDGASEAEGEGEGESDGEAGADRERDGVPDGFDANADNPCVPFAQSLRAAERRRTRHRQRRRRQRR